MRKYGPVEKGHVVMEYMEGNTKIRICDDYCRNKTKEEVDEILRRIAEIAMNAYAEEAWRKEQEKNKAMENAN